MSFRRPNLCRLCEFPVVDGGVQLSTDELEKVSDWWEQKTGRGLLVLEEEEENSWICQFCSWDARYDHEVSENKGADAIENIWWSQSVDKNYERFYKKDLIKPCFVKLPILQKDDCVTIKIDGAEEKIADVPSISYVHRESRRTKPANTPSIKKSRRPCIYCGRIISSNYFSIHMRRYHHDMIRCLHTFCIHYFKTKEDRSEHVKNVHAGSGEMMCIYCKRWYLRTNLQCHMRYKHKIEFIRCDYHTCINYFKTEEEKVNHVQKYHSRENSKYQCLYCKMEFASFQSLARHTESSHDQSYFKCKIKHRCGFYCKTGSELKFHIDTVHFDILEKEYACSVCNYRTDHKHGLKAHVLSMHSSQNVECHLCEKILKHKVSLEKHIAFVHKGKKKACPHCQKPLAKLNQHLKAEVCTSCNLNLPCRGLIQKHYKQCNVAKT